MQARITYAEAKEIALLRLELRASWDRGDHAAAKLALAGLAQRAGNDNELTAECRRWWVKLAS
jgi:predicted ATPase